ncbi:MAG: hypothetical protein O7J95_03760, partial [Planctomycetota bacterium]|nr:hypothetical protein [Planctomycetota bacterium]
PAVFSVKPPARPHLAPVVRCRRCLAISGLLISLVGAVAITRGLGAAEREVSLYLAHSSRSGVELRLFQGDAPADVGPDLGLMEWRTFGLRGFSPNDPRVGAPISEARGSVPRIRVGTRYQIVAYRSVERDVSGFLAFGPWGLRVLLEAPGDHFKPREEGSHVTSDGASLAVMVGDEGAQAIYWFFLDPEGPVVKKVLVPENLGQLEPRSLTTIPGALFFSGQSSSGEWFLGRAVARGAASSPSITARIVAGPFAEFSPDMVSSPAAVTFLAGPTKEYLDVYVVGASGFPRNVTRAPGRYREQAVDQRLAVSHDGESVAFNLDLTDNLETYYQPVATPGPVGRFNITDDARFNRYIDQEVWIFFDERNYLFFTGGHEPFTTDLFMMRPGDPSSIVNLTRTGSGSEPPFRTTGSLSVENVVQTPGGVMVVGASGFTGGQPGVVGISVTTGETVFEVLGAQNSRKFFVVGPDLYFLADNTSGGYDVFRVRDERLEPVASAIEREPWLLEQCADRAFFFIPGKGVLYLPLGGESRHIIAGEDVAPVAKLASDRTLVVVARDLPDGGRRYSVVDLQSGEETTLLDDDVRATVVAAIATPLELFVRGDANGDGRVDVSDPVSTLGYLFLGSSEIRCLDAADANDDGELAISDPIRTLQLLFLGGPRLPAPYPTRGEDPTEDALDCPSSP